MYVARKFPEYTQASAWVSLLPGRTPNAPLERDIVADVVVIGAGFAGLSAARTLLGHDPTLQVAVLEASEVGLGPTGRNSGFVIDLPHEVSSDDYAGGDASGTLRQIALNRTAIRLVREVAEENGCGRDVFDPCGKYNVAMSEQGDGHIVSYAKQLDALGESYRLLDAKDTEKLTGTRAFTSSIFMPGTAIIQPVAYIRVLATSLQRSARIYENTPAVSIAKHGGAWQVRTPKGSVSAAKVILAANGHAQSFGLFKGELMHVYTYASMTEAFDPARLGGERSWAATPAFPMGTTVRRVAGERGDRVLVRSRYTYNPRLKIGEGDVARAGRKHDVKFADRFPMLKGLRMEYRWGGAMALTWNGVPAFGEIDSGLFSACACNGVGATKATASGIAAADVALGIETELVSIFRRFAAPKPLPPQPFLTIGAKANLAYKEWRAGKE
ncbi:MAG: FAD-binding oxidoreductase [Burkholderia gladioli]